MKEYVKPTLITTEIECEDILMTSVFLDDGFKDWADPDEIL